MTTSRITQVRLVGGHRALDLVNTVAPRLPAGQGSDYLAAPADLLTWSQRTGLLDTAAASEVAAAWNASPAAGRRALTAVREIREALHEILSAHLAGADLQTAAQDQLDHLATAWASALPRSRLQPAAGRRGIARWAAGSSPALLVADRVAQDAVDLVCELDVTRLRRCPVEEGGCGWLFLDLTRNSSRRWCAMEDCGSGAKARRLTARRRASRAVLNPR
jgi:predicted RNA-binding Zn ribbon-like protein